MPSLSPCCVYDFSSYPGRKYHIRVLEPGAKVVLSARVWWKNISILVYKDKKIIKFTYRIYYKNEINHIVEFEIPVESSCDHFPLLFLVKWPFRDRNSTAIHYIILPFIYLYIPNTSVNTVAQLTARKLKLAEIHNHVISTVCFAVLASSWRKIFFIMFHYLYS